MGGHLRRILEPGDEHDHDRRVAMGERGGGLVDPGHRPAEDPDLGHRHRRDRRGCPFEDGVDGCVIEGVEEQRAMDRGAALLGALEQLVDADVGHRHDELGHRRRDLAERLERRLTRLRVPVEHEHQGQRRLPVECLGDERRRRGGHQDRDRRQRLGRTRCQRDEALEHLPGRGQEQGATEDRGHGVQPELEAGHDAEVAAAAPDRPEQVGMVGLVGDDDPAVGRHHLDRQERVDRQAVFAHEPADPATEGQPGDADAAGVPERRGQTVLGSGCGVLAGGQARLRPGDASVGVDVEALHQAEVEDDAALDRAEPGQAVRTAPHRELEAGVTGEDDRPGDVGGRGRADDQRRVAVDGRVMDLAGHVVAGILGSDHRAREAGTERGDIERAAVVEGGDAGEGHRRGFLSCAGRVGRGSCDRCSDRPGHAESGHWTAPRARRMT